MTRTLIHGLLLATLLGCGPSEDGAGGAAPVSKSSGPEDDPQDSGHGAALDLGTLSLAGRTFRVTRHGEVEPGVEGAFSVKLEDGTAADLAGLNVYLWVEDRSGNQLSAPAKGHVEGDGLHYHVLPRAGAGAPYRAVVRVRTGEVDERGGLPLDGHGHEHAGSPHDGVAAKFASADGSIKGHLELKLHDDKGDLELWLSRDEAKTEPFDLPVAAEVKVAFVEMSKEVVLRARNHDKNEDEEGQPNVRSGKTNYFIYPSKEGEDASWLEGKTFQSIVELVFEVDGQRFRSEEFVLTPHSHDD